ncbi:MAG: type I DNA topoisomerase [Chloroflexi bacterium]|nr:type I DNA topoisomerase [Chloroflexota bacterium]
MTQSKALVVVESPAKARTIERILGSGYSVKASLGHVRDLPESKLGVDVTNGFEPTYEVSSGKKKVVSEIKKLAREASRVYLATDPDREGEAISWHLAQAANLKDGQIARVVFHEITEPAVKAAFRHPRTIDMHLVEAQQARRVLDRLVGYKLSPLLWSKLRWPNLSAGRVQSAALRLVVEREEEVRRFVPAEYWTIEATLAKQHGAVAQRGPFRALLHSRVGQRSKLEVRDQQEAQRLVQELDGASYQVAEVAQRQVHQRPAPPFITSTLQQEAWRKLRYSAKRTMAIAQQLYEGVVLGDQGSVGLITYMRTDSTHVAESALHEARAYILERFGKEFVPERPRVYRTKVKGAQEAHEAIRPTSVRREPEQVKAHLTNEQLRLYDLIWKRFLASQMADALAEATTVNIHATPPSDGGAYLFRATGSVLRFLGFRTLYQESEDEPAQEEGVLPELARGEGLDCQGLDPQQHFTQPPPRYTEASLIKALEEKGIGRPSTYAAIVSTIQERGYVRKENGRLMPHPLGEAVYGLLVQHFSDVVDLGFTAQMEEQLDDVARGQLPWAQVLQEFYPPFEHDLESAEKAVKRVDVPVGETCEKCGRPMVLRRGRFGPFVACSGYPECRNTHPYRVKVGVDCPQCGGELVERRAKRGKRRSLFYGCSNYPTCSFAVSSRPLPSPCPECNGLLVSAGRQRARCTQCQWKGAPPAEEREGGSADEDAAPKERGAVASTTT